MNAGPLLDVDRAQVTRTGRGTVVVDDPECPLLVELAVGDVCGRRQVTRLTVQVRHPAGRIGESTLRRLPVRQLAHVAAQHAAAASHPNEVFYLKQARPRQQGRRRWDDEHWLQVLQVYHWAKATGRPGGPVQAVADMWGVAKAPTAYRWVKTARDILEPPTAVQR